MLTKQGLPTSLAQRGIMGDVSGILHSLSPCLAYFIQHSAHPCSIYRHPLPFLVTFHSVERPCLVSLFIHPETFGLISPFSHCESATMNSGPQSQFTYGFPCPVGPMDATWQAHIIFLHACVFKIYSFILHVCVGMCLHVKVRMWRSVG